VEFHVSFEGRRDLSGQIYRQVRAAILDGRLRPGEPLPPTRELSRSQAVSRNTVGTAYDRLAAEGFVETRLGAGTFVSTAVRVGARTPGRERPGGRLRPRAVWAEIPDLPDLSGVPEIDLRTGLPDTRLFPWETWRRLVADELRTSAVGNGMYGDPTGHSGLRAAIVRHVGVSRAVRATVEDVFVTNGTQQAMDLIGRVLLDPGACVAVEDPGYRPPRRLWVSLSARVVDVPVDAEGIVVDAIPSDAKIVYVTPSHQFPLGMPMSMPRRLALLDWAARHGAVIVEDDYDSEFRFAGRPIEPLQSLDDDGLVIYVGSFSKVMMPTLRLGFLVAPAALHRALRAARYVADWHTPLPTQAALARFLDEGAMARHIRKMRHEYLARHERIAATLASDFGEWLEVIPSVAGLHLSARCRPGVTVDMAAVQARCRTEGVSINILREYGAGPDGVALGYGAVAIPAIDEGLRRLRKCLVSQGA
jgi:GntR family transcriptional regulator/MocR family aminotransferase